MRLHRKGQRMLGSGRVQAACQDGPLDGERIWVPEGTKEFFALEDSRVALSPDDLLPIWRYRRSHGTMMTGDGYSQVFFGHRDTEL